jgi:hypothetical protein
MKWLLLLTILSGYSGSSTTAANFDSKEACEAAGKSHDQAIHQLHLAFVCCCVDMQPDIELVRLKATRPYPRPFSLWHESF